MYIGLPGGLHLGGYGRVKGGRGDETGERLGRKGGIGRVGRRKGNRERGMGRLVGEEGKSSHREVKRKGDIEGRGK